MFTLVMTQEAKANSKFTVVIKEMTLRVLLWSKAHKNKAVIKNTNFVALTPKLGNLSKLCAELDTSMC